MLVQLQISDLAIIENLTIDFSPNLNVVTGETGAGKSIIIKALGLLLGSKSTSGDLRDGSERASITGVFRVRDNHPALGILDRLEIPYDVDKSGILILVRRIMYRSGRTAGWICDVPVTRSSLRELGYLLVDICGQHDNQKILSPKEQGKILDEFLTKGDLLDRVVGLYQEAQDSHGKLARFIESYQEHLKEKDYWEFRGRELQELSPDEAEYAELVSSFKLMEGQIQDARRLQEAVDIIDSGVDGGAISSCLLKARGSLKQTTRSELTCLADDLEKIASEIEDLSFRANGLLASWEDSQSDGRRAYARLELYSDMFRKLGVKDIHGLISESKKVADKIAFFEDAQTHVEDLIQDLVRKTTLLSQYTQDLSAERRKASLFVERDVKKELTHLSMPESSMKIDLSPVNRSFDSLEEELQGLFSGQYLHLYSPCCQVLEKTGSTGSEIARFLFVSAPGSQPRPLEQVASGGEVSRIMLALKRSLAAGAETCVLVFDEIDAGISGKVADLVGRKLSALGISFQVLCVSHLAQVAAYADSHFVVRKNINLGRAETTIRKLSMSERKEEIARLLSGEEVTRASLSNAKSIIKKAIDYRQSSKELPGNNLASR